MLEIICGILVFVVGVLLWFCRQCARDAIRHGKRADHYQLIAEQHAFRHALLERVYNDLKARAYLRDARGRMRHAKDVLP